MKAHKIIMLILLLIAPVMASASDVFRLPRSEGQSKVLVNRTLTENGSLEPFQSATRIAGLSISGQLTKGSDDYFVRVLLKDKDGHRHLILEAYDMLNSAETQKLDNYCEETAILNNIVPDEIIVIVKDATLTIDCIDYKPSSVNGMMRRAMFRQKQASIRKKQSDDIIKRINIYNEAHRKLWRAGNTPLSETDYETRQRIIGFGDNINTGGYEYYAEGIFEVGEAHLSNTMSSYSPYVDHFDWRDRHGRNWITGMRDQDSSNYCFAFAPVASLEAASQLYYNDLTSIYDIDLSEMHVARCSNAGAGTDPYNDGGYTDIAISYIASYGVCDETSYPYEAGTNHPCMIDQINPELMVKPISYHLVDKSQDDNIKSALIHYGPLVAGYNPAVEDNLGHAMALVGYGTIHAGDTIRSYYSNSGLQGPDPIIAYDDYRIGKTYWIFKNSYNGNNDANLGGYQYIMFYDNNDMSNVYAFNYPISLSVDGIPRTSNDIICEDRDGDGYYFWGIGPKPSHCPSTAPDEPDGDDSDARYGPMDLYGNLMLNPVNPEITPACQTISSSVTYSTNQTIDCGIEITSGGVLTVQGTLTMSDYAFIRIAGNGTLIVDGGVIENANLAAKYGSNVIIINNGSINLANGKAFSMPKGAAMNLQYGNINN